MRIIYSLIPLMLFMSACSKPSSPDTPPTDNTTTNNTTINNTNNVDHQNTNLIDSPEQTQAPPPAAAPILPPPDLTPPDGDKRLYCERLKYEELNLVNQAKEVRDRALANPLTREPRQHLFTQHEQIKTQLRDVQATMSTQCNLAPNFFDFPSEQELKKQLIELSIQSYRNHGRCACPYSGCRSNAWSQPGGFEPYCYESDIQ